MAEPRQVPSQSVKHSAHSCAFVRRRLPRLALFLSDQRSQGPLDRGCERFEEWVSLLEPITPSCDNRYWVPFILGQAILQPLIIFACQLVNVDTLDSGCETARMPIVFENRPASFDQEPSWSVRIRGGLVKALRIAADCDNGASLGVFLDCELVRIHDGQGRVR